MAKDKTPHDSEQTLISKIAERAHGLIEDAVLCCTFRQMDLGDTEETRIRAVRDSRGQVVLVQDTHSAPDFITGRLEYDPANRENYFLIKGNEKLSKNYKDLIRLLTLYDF